MDIQNVHIDEVDYAIRGNANLGIKETGKTYGAMWFAERLLDAGIPIVAVDPSGVWRYLKVPRPGKTGYPVVVVGDNADIPLSPDTAGPIMHAAMEAGVSVVFDLFSKHLSKSDWRKIVKDICEVLLYENQDYGLRHVFLEEAKEYVPQQVYDKLVFSAVEKLIRIGGNSQVGITLINQRAEGINKDVLELCASLFLYKQVGRNSISNLEKWLKKVEIDNQQEIIKSLFTLPKGNCWFFDEDSRNPVLIKIPEKNTVHPDRRQTGTILRLKPVDVSNFVAKLNKVLQKHKPEKKNPILRDADRIIEPAHFDDVNVQLLKEAGQQNEKLKIELKIAERRIQELQQKLDTVRKLLEPQYQSLQTLFTEIGENKIESTSIDSSRYDHWFPALVGYQKDMLRLFIQHRRLTTKKLALLLGRTVNGTFTEYLGQLKRKGLISEENNEWVLVEL